MIGPVPASKTQHLEALLLEDVSPQVLTLGLLQTHGPALFHACVQDGDIAGVFYLGADGVAVPAAVKSRAAAMEIGESLRKREVTRLLGTRLAVAGVMAGIGRNGVPKQSLRLHQVTADDMGPFVNPELRQATGDDLPAILRSLEMATAEPGSGEIRAPAPDETEKERLARQISLGRIWMMAMPETSGQVAFRVEVEVESRHGAHLGSIYTHPAERQKGLASLCLGELARTMLSRTPTLSALVPEENPAALKVIRNVGFGPGETWTQVELR